ncbi:AraC family transcriptional regulator [Pseudoalteromonas sp. DL2-H2.2]|uniref:AraC family transcriptional regulator n=1 Tax=Pseudoalteromonas sp. DL2-H2.2 TaxID=2908889 RepID=UPI001F3C6086|nr:AraC family transcriptional regulator [Pseudoalteromonas sp. DL2-H2.2]MCF2908563.1 AraC family transcriptional regulator [Pseudoalteromonas sp. DL2-H2.2]
MTTRATTLNYYQQRLLRVIDYMYDHVDQDLDVNTLADVACMSCYHFHRIFREFMGETVNATVRRMRLLKAASYLVRSTLTQQQIARRVNYGSVEAFNRAFSRHYGMTPNQFRQQQQSESLHSAAFYPAQPQEYNIMYQVEQTQQNALTLIGLAHQGDYMQIGKTFEKLGMMAGSVGLINEQTRYFGIYYDDPQTVEQTKLKAMACITLAPGADFDQDTFEAITIPPGKLISLTFKGDYSELEQPYNWLFGQWLPQSGLELVDFPPFEEYLNDTRDTAPQDLLTRINCLVQA